MKFTTGKLRTACDTINPTNGKWGEYFSNWVPATESNFNSFHNTIDGWRERADRRYERIEFHYDGSAQYEVREWNDVERFFAIEYYSRPLPAKPWVLISGDPVEGFQLHGPFATGDEAAEHGRVHFEGDWWPAVIEKAEP